MYIFEGKVLDAYGVLGLQFDATDADVKKAYRNLSRKYHPDFNVDNTEWAHKKMQVVNAARDEIEGRSKGTYKPSFSKYQASDGSRPDLENNESVNKTSSNMNCNSGKSNNYSGNYYSNDDDLRKKNTYSWNDSYFFSEFVSYNKSLYSIMVGYLSLNMMDPDLSAKEKGRIKKLIELFKEQQNLYDDILKKTRSNNINVADLKLQIQDIESNFIKKLENYLNEELFVIKSAIHSVFIDIKRSDYIKRVETCIYLASFYEDMIEKNIKMYISYNNQDEYNFICQKVSNDFNLFLKNKNYKFRNLGKGIRSWKFDAFLSEYCKNFSFDLNYGDRGNSRR